MFSNKNGCKHVQWKLNLKTEYQPPINIFVGLNAARVWFRTGSNFTTHGLLCVEVSGFIDSEALKWALCILKPYVTSHSVNIPSYRLSGQCVSFTYPFFRV
jgi:hypothetical protein